jgi:dienelactone hydrolase
MPRSITRRNFLASTAALAAIRATAAPASPSVDLDKLPPIAVPGDLAAAMVEGMHKYLDGCLARGGVPATSKRLHHELLFGSPPEWSQPLRGDNPIKVNARSRHELCRLIGAIDERVKSMTLDVVAPVRGSAGPIAKGDDYAVHAVRWPVFDGVYGEGLLLEPEGKPMARVVAIPDADQTPEVLVGLAPGVFPAGQFARRLAENGCQVLLPTLIDRQDTWSGNPKLGRMTNQPHREFIYRMAYELGRHIIGFEVQKVLAAVDWFTKENAKTKLPIGLYGYAEGGLLALYSATLDDRIEAAVVSCYFTQRAKVVADEPIYRNVWNLLPHFRDVNLALQAQPAGVVIETCLAPPVEGPPKPRDGRSGAAPGRLVVPRPEQVRVEMILHQAPAPPKLRHVHSSLHAGEEPALQAFFEFLGVKDPLKPLGAVPTFLADKPDAEARQKRQFHQLVDHTQRLMRQAESVRQQFFWKNLGGLTPPARLEDFQKSIEPFRKQFSEEIIGQLPPPTLPPNPRLRPLHDEPKWKSYEVMLDVYPNVFAYGILCVPKDLKEGEKRPVVVCQHGLEGRPTDVVNPKQKTKYYNSFGSALADLGYVVFAPQNPYIFENKFRQLQRKANPLGLSLFSFIVRQHERILDWLETLPFVDPKRIAFYGLSYGGKTAMRVPAILKKYCLSICSGDFNEWIWKNVSVDFRGSYMFTREYEMYEFDLGNTFGYAEMAALIAPRPFMVERGHDDGVGIDEWVAYEYAKVRRLYAKLGIPDRTAIEFFNGGHEVNGKGTFEFLKRHLGWPTG